MNAQVIPFPVVQVPPPAPRPILQPSAHPRGARGFVFTNRVDEWHAPGVVVGGRETRAAVDSAWLAERVLGPPKRGPKVWPGVAVAGERARTFGAQVGLWSFQGDGAAFLAERDYAILADAPGVGKTGQALVAAEARLSLGTIPTPFTPVVLILCPALAKRHWQREVKKWTGHQARVLDGLRPDPELLDARYVIANYDILFGQRRGDAAGVVHDVAELPGWGALLSNRFLIVIADEAHMLKGKVSRRGTAVRQVCKNAVCVWLLTGTPMPNYVRDIWALVDICSDGLFGKYWPFAQTYCAAYQGAYGWVDTGRDNLEELQGRLSYFMLGRPANTVPLPEKRRECFPVDVEVSAPTVREGLLAKDKSGSIAKAFRLTARAKRSAVVQMAVEYLEARQKVVIFTYMREQADAIGKEIKAKIDCAVTVVSGDMSADGRDAAAGVFRDAQAPACFVATIDSVGQAISLVGANLVVFADLVPEPWKLIQAERRAHRFGSQIPVLVRYVIAAGTIDDGLAETVIDKLGVIEAALGQEADQTTLSQSLGAKSSEEIVDGLFSRLLAWKAESDG